MKGISKLAYVFLFAAATIVYVFGLFIDVMEIDAAQYASLSHEMLLTKSYTMLHFRGLNYLDKPPLCFWLEIISYKVFGINNFAYKFPSFLFTLLGILATFKLAKRFYSEKIAWLAVLILYTCQAFFLFNQDVRTDTVLTASVIIAIWQLTEYMETGKKVSFILGFTAIAAALLAKGPIGLMVPVIAISGQIIYKKSWKDFFRIEWMIGIVYVTILLTPFLIGLFKQYGSSGLRFYFWTQSFGRITGESPWRNEPDYLFFVHTFIWAFLPWAFLSLFAFASTISTLYTKSKKIEVKELLSLAGVLIPFIVLSFSKYKLPHYIFILFPLTAIITASSVFLLLEKYKVWKVILKWMQLITVIILWSMLFLLLILVFPCRNIYIWTVLVFLNLLTIYYLLRWNSDWSKIIIAPAITIIGVNFMLNAYFYPNLLDYQAGKSMASAKTEAGINIYSFNSNIFSYDFYARRLVKTLPTDSVRNFIEGKKKVYVITDAEGLNFLRKEKADITEMKAYNDYPVTKLTIEFLNPVSRTQSLRKYFLIKMN